MFIYKTNVKQILVANEVLLFYYILFMIHAQQDALTDN
jgi:hypothetical protein